jgi:hypothetical protein
MPRHAPRYRTLLPDFEELRGQRVLLRPYQRTRLSAPGVSHGGASRVDCPDARTTELQLAASFSPLGQKS